MTPKKATSIAAACVALSAIAVTPAVASAVNRPEISWQSCDSTGIVQCGQISVPLDWAHQQTSPTTDLKLARLPAAKPDQRIGTLFFNPGGPGEGEVGYLVSAQARQYYFPPAIRDRFDIVAVEPRGTGQNTPLNCPVPVDNSVTKFPSNQAESSALVASNAKLGAQCVKAAGPITSYLDTASVARDMDLVRSDLGEQQISFLAVSYGTMLAQSYAELFPERVRAMVLDGVVDRSLPWQRMAESDALAVEAGVGRLAQWCDTHAACALHGTDVRKAISQLLTRADAGQLKDGDRSVRAEEVAGAINTGLNDPSFYAPVAASVKQAAQTGIMGDLVQLTSAKNPDYPLYRAIICQDVPVPAAAASQFPAEARKVRALAPTLRGYSEFWDIASGCIGWPAPVRWAPHRWTVPSDFAAVLLLSGAHDVATPRPWAESVHSALPGSRLVRWDGDGHAAWPAHDAGAVQAAVGYLTG
jgi:pimeloyl-ACP methyl ester carboxylesterase